ncbi:FBP domain-containing protein [Saliterribacillus persicus]|uniref:Treble-clef zinc-finger protein n=1 Tax=Saliterribacillus persicus TaxID=930114 RepID=A0A368XBF9_9BACI|nr:FBP domain-containing protein [Saliterribacillus persicus]RCW63354.1 treble-clef zinc-finger protein [Saliterribacillus persicus]
MYSPKAKKLKIPPLDTLDFRDISYLGWYDIRSAKKVLVVEYNGKLKGIQGSFDNSIKGICSLCNGYEDVGLFMARTKTGKATYKNKGNFICRDSNKCNENLITLEKLNKFVENY